MMPDSTSSSRQFAVAATVSVLLGLIWWKLPHPVLAGAGLLPLLLVLTLRAPFLLMLGFVIFSFFRIHEVFPQLYPLRIPQLLAAGTLASLAFNWFAYHIKPFWSRELWIFATFFMLVTIGVFVATNRAEAMGSYTGTYIKIAIILIAFAWLCTTSRHFAVSAVSIVIAGLCVGVVALSNKAAGIGLVEGTRVTIGRDIGSMLGDPNDLALVLLFPASFALAMLLTKHTGKLAPCWA
ncbi:hypothetical protein ACFQMB_04270 [Pseudobowmanella zhangzhouensis]|uniref:hypothetical protein n=1 Tax=Pseudobowmanella zhangzhouensis TaxID=1537679 RepID=UPI003620C63F